ncbi:polyprenyl synthetase family protein [Chloroflexota bacterium]
MARNDTVTLASTRLASALVQWPEPVQKGLAAVERRLNEVKDGHHPVLKKATKHLVSSGGKRIRPLVSLLTSAAFNADFERSVSLAAGAEMLHTATLVHDDMIDGALVRRNSATLNADWAPDLAVLMGDYLFARAAKLVAQVKDVDIMELFAETLMVILNGEISQRFTKWRANRQEYYERIYAKTAALFVLATQAAAVLGEGSQSRVEALVDYGRNIGMAFQVVDDILDYSGQAELIGKPAGNDLRQGLITLPAIYYLENNPADADFQNFLQNRNSEPAQLNRLVEKVRQSGALEEAMGEARQFAVQGQNALSILPASPYVNALNSLANSAIDRDF